MVTFIACWICATIGFCAGLFWAGCYRDDNEADLGEPE